MRTLRADEIDCRVQSVKENGCSLLLYKDARCDMRILDETYGAMNWQRRHTRDNANCIVSVWDREKQQWIEKEDTGTESNTEKEKGQASDSFKRACFNWGIGRELYSAPIIWIPLTAKEINNYNGKIQVKTKFKVSEIGYNERNEINYLVIKDNKGNERYRLGTKNTEDIKESLVKAKFITLYNMNEKNDPKNADAEYKKFIEGQQKKGYSLFQINAFLAKRLSDKASNT